MTISLLNRSRVTLAKFVPVENSAENACARAASNCKSLIQFASVYEHATTLLGTAEAEGVITLRAMNVHDWI